MFRGLSTLPFAHDIAHTRGRSPRLGGIADSAFGGTGIVAFGGGRGVCRVSGLIASNSHRPYIQIATSRDHRPWHQPPRSCIRAVRWFLVSVGLFFAQPVFGQDGLRQAEQTLSTARRDLEKQFGHLDWQQQGDEIERALQTIWSDNGWADESDKFAFEVARDTTAIPPWQPMKRIDLMVERYRQRYQIADKDAGLFKRKVVLELGGFLMRNGPTLFKQAQASLDITDGETNLSPEKVAEMAREIEPIRDEALAMIDRLIVEVEGVAPESAKEIIQRDIDSFHKRETHIDKMLQKWKRGEWNPRDWGWTNDHDEPRLADGGAANSDTQGGHGQTGSDSHAASLIKTWLPHDPATWFVYVLDFQKRFALDAAQATTARSIEAELVKRAKTYGQSHKKELAEVPPNERPSHPAFGPILAMFDDLRERLDGLPTSGQRERADR